jgi:hypothetical protein
MECLRLTTTVHYGRSLALRRLTLIVWPETVNQPPLRTKAMANQTVQDQYVTWHTLCLERLEQLQQAMFDLPAPGGDVEIDWGHVGSVTEIAKQLEQTLAFTAGGER